MHIILHSYRITHKPITKTFYVYVVMVLSSTRFGHNSDQSPFICMKRLEARVEMGVSRST